MDRRKFLKTALGTTAGTLAAARALAKPCPPMNLIAPGAMSGPNPVCGVSVSAAGLTDWNTRSTGAGVIWAHRFNDASVVSKFMGATDKTTAGQYIRQNSTDGILGDGCLEMFFPQGALPQYGWLRPLFPITGDINKANLPVLPDTTFDNIYPSMFTNYIGGGHFVNSDYLITANQTWSKPGGVPSQLLRSGEFWVQYRVKFSTSRFSNVENTNPAGDGSGKYLMLACSYDNCSQEIVLQAKTIYGGGWFEWYTNEGDAFNSFLRNPQNEGSNPIYMQPIGASGLSSCVVGNPNIGLTNGQGCWCYQPEKWITMMIHVTPGHQVVNTGSDWYTSAANSGCRDTGIEVLAALPGATSWTTVANYKNFIFQFGGDYIGADNAQPYGWSWVNFTPYNGGASSQPVMSPTGWYHRFDQIICSTKPIALPSV